MNKKLRLVSTVNMSHEEWIERRRKSIGGSDAAAVVGLNAFVSQYSLWAEKAGKVPGFSGNLATEVGTYMEEFVAQKFAKETGKRVRRCNNIIYNPDFPFAHVNIDRDIVGEDAGLECKTTDSLNMKKFKNGEYPSNYYVQCVHSMAITGAKRWYLAVLIGNRDFKIFTIERDENEIAALMEAEKAFWWFVQHDTPPAPDGSSATTETIKALYPESCGGKINLTAYDTELEQYIRLCRQIKELEAMRDEMANKVKVYMADAKSGESGSYRVSWASSDRKTFDVNRFRADYPDLDLTNYYNVSKARTFRVTERKET